MEKSIKKIGDVMPPVQKLEGEQVDKNDIVNKTLIVRDFAVLSSSFEGQDEFAVVQAECEKKLVTFSGGKVITDKLKTLTKGSLPVEAKLVLVKSKKGRGYFDLVNA